jgi:hypothetical protein
MFASKICQLQVNIFFEIPKIITFLTVSVLFVVLVFDEFPDGVFMAID